MIIACAMPCPYLLQPSATFKVRCMGPPVHVLELYIVMSKADMGAARARNTKGDKVAVSIVGLIDRDFLKELVQR
jgi:hypothetical protein